MCRRNATHDRLEFTTRLIVKEQILGHCTLVAQHVDEKAQRTETAAQLLKTLCRCGAGRHGLNEQLFNAIAHAQSGDRCLVQPQD